jgi:protein TonB
MSGALVPSAPPERRSDPGPDDDPIFSLVVSDPPPRPWRVLAMLRMSAVAHVLIASAVVLVPLFLPPPSPQQPDYIRALLYDPPPPPPPPLPKGSALVEKPQPARPVTPETKPETPRLESPLRPESRENQSVQAGSPTGSDFGVPEGMEGGVEGGMVGGVPGGVLGGVIGGTGSIVLDYDQAPRPVRMPKPQYPQEAFVKKVEGTVVVEIVIDITGRVVFAKVVQSIPQLDAAAVQCVYQWVFQPAVKHGRPVATRATAPVTFRIF